MSYQNLRIKGIPAPLPYDYDRLRNFTDYGIQNPGEPIQGSDLDAELNAIQQALDETQARLRLVQRDDGALANLSVGFDQLQPSVQIGVNPPTDWMEFTSYTVRDSVIFDNREWYVALQSHVSSGSFQDDLADGKWASLIDYSIFIDEAKNWATYPVDQLVPEGNGVDDYSALHHATKAALSQSAAAQSETNAAQSETNAAQSEASADADATSAAQDAQAASDRWDDIQGRYYGDYASDPSTDPLGNAPDPGDRYFNTTAGKERVWDGAAWVDNDVVGLTTEIDQRVRYFDTVSDLDAAGTLFVGQLVRTKGYDAVGDGGGNDYEIVSGGTGTADGGSFIDLATSGFQAKGLFPKGVYLMQFGPVGDGVADDTTLLQNAIDYVAGGKQRLNGHAGKTHLVSSSLDMRQVWAIDIRSEIVSADDTFTPLVIGGNSSTAKNSTIRLGTVRASGVSSPVNPNIRVMGAKNTVFHLERADFLQLYADTDSSVSDAGSIAYCTFYCNQVNLCQLANNTTTDGSATQWINENRFISGRYQVVEILDGTYFHNHNIWYSPSIEGSGSAIRLASARYNIFRNVRAENISEITLGTNTHNNHIELSWAGSIPRDVAGKIDTLSDSGVLNVVEYQQLTNMEMVDVFTASWGQGTANLGQGYQGGLTDVSTGFQIDASFTDIFRSLLIPVSKGMAVSFNSSAAWWRLDVYCYDSSGNPISPGSDPGIIDGEFTTPFAHTWDDANSRYRMTSNRSAVHFAVTADTGYIELVLSSGGSVTGNVFKHAGIYLYVANTLINQPLIAAAKQKY